MPLGTPYTPLPRGGNAGDVLTKDNANDNACSWRPAGAGTAGADGITWYSGTIDPTTQGVNNDLYLNTTSCDVFKKIAGSWTLQVNIKGATGATGAAGTNGTNGANGTNGTDGKTLLSGAVDPTTEGADNDFYLNTTSCDLFKKLSGTWTLQVNIKGATGSTGAAGADGADGTNGADGRSYIWHGAYDAGHAYAVDDTVSYGGSSYVCIQASTGNLPTNTSYWNLLASKGDTGSAGAGVYITTVSDDMTATVYDGINIFEFTAATAKTLTFANPSSSLKAFVIIRSTWDSVAHKVQLSSDGIDGKSTSYDLFSFGTTTNVKFMMMYSRNSLWRFITNNYPNALAGSWS